MKRLRVALAALCLVAASLLFAPAMGAQAANGCGGVYQGSRTLTERAQLDVYLENGTTNCVALRTVGAYYGKAQWMGVGIGGEGSLNTCPYNSTYNGTYAVCGNYHYWVGGARVYAPHSCINMWAAIQVNGVIYSTWWPNQFCE